MSRTESQLHQALGRHCGKLWKSGVSVEFLEGFGKTLYMDGIIVDVAALSMKAF
jgi:hypothetical protein